MNLKAKLSILLFLGIFCEIPLSTIAFADDAKQAMINAKCLKGPKRLNIENQAWDLYRCDDDQSLAFLSVSGAPSYPFFFLLNCKEGGCHLYGEGTGDKASTDIIYEKLRGVGLDGFKFLQNTIPK